MTEAAPPVPREDLTLSPIELTEPSDSLPRSFDPTPDQRQLNAWKEEAESRIDAFEACMLIDDSAVAVFDRINGGDPRIYHVQSQDSSKLVYHYNEERPALD